MADYYPLLARAIGGLPDKSAEARKAVYERARRALTAQLRAVEPPLAEDDVEREQQALESAIRRIEADQAAPAPATPSAPPPAPATSTPVTPASPVPPPVTPSPVTPPAAPAAPAVPPPFPRPSAPEPPAPPARSAEPTGDFAPSEAEAVAAGIEPASYAGKDDGERHDWRSEAARMVRAREAAALSDGDEAEEAAVDDGATTETPEEASSGGGRARLFGALIFLALLIAGAVVGYTQRETILALIGGATTSTPPQTAQAPARPATPDAPKSTDRIAQAPDSSRPSQPAQPAQPSQNAPSGTAGPGIDAPQRAVLFEESPGGGEQGLQQYDGTVVWRTERTPGSAGTAPDVGIRADVTIPARDISATLTLRRNQDTSIPASHIIEVQFKLPPNFDLGNVSNVPGMRAKASEGAQGAPLVGLAVRVAPSYFLIGLSALDSDVQRNLSFLITRNWLDLPIVFENGRRAILVLEKGEAGDQAFRQAFSAWGLAAPPAQENNAPAR